MRGTDLIAIVALMTGGFAVCYWLLMWKLRAIVAEQHLKIADHIGALDQAIRALETRLTEHHMAGAELSRLEANAQGVNSEGAESDLDGGEETAEIAPEVQAVIAAAAMATLGENAIVRSVKTAPSPWTQQGRVLVQGGHNLRVRP
jgi:hypothetical protein